MDIYKQKLLKERRKVAQQMPRGSDIIKGSLVKLRRVCGKPNCRCNKGEKHMSLYISQSYKGKTKMTYIPRRQVEYVKDCVESYKRLLKGVEKLTEINLKLIKQR